MPNDFYSSFENKKEFPPFQIVQLNSYNLWNNITELDVLFLFSNKIFSLIFGLFCEEKKSYWFLHILLEFHEWYFDRFQKVHMF